MGGRQRPGQSDGFLRVEPVHEDASVVVVTSGTTGSSERDGTAGDISALQRARAERIRKRQQTKAVYSSAPQSGSNDRALRVNNHNQQQHNDGGNSHKHQSLQSLKQLNNLEIIGGVQGSNVLKSDWETARASANGDNGGKVKDDSAQVGDDDGKVAHRRVRQIGDRIKEPMGAGAFNDAAGEPYVFNGGVYKQQQLG